MRQPTKFGKYLLLERIAVGGMAEVFVAKAFGVEGFERLLAIKKILPTMGEDPEFIHMFVDEARIAVRLQHRNIVQVLELGKHDDNLYIAMEYVSGRDLRQLMERYRKRQEPMPLPQACLIVAEVCEALDHAHHKRDAQGRPMGIVHRDVSPQNVLVGFEGEVKLIDFGIAKAESRLSRTQSGILKGKFSYMSPEQVKGHELDGRSDVYACGILLWELVNGEKLFTGDSDVAVLEKVRRGIVAPPRNCPPELCRVILKALAADPAQRYQAASEFHDDLRRFTVSGGAVFGARQLAEWLRQEFRAEWQKEQERLRGWLEAGRGLRPGPAARLSLPKVMVDKDTLAVPDAHELPTIQMDDEVLLAAERSYGTRLLPALPEDAPGFDLAAERTAAPRRQRGAPFSRPGAPSARLRRWGYAALPLAVATIGVLVVMSFSVGEPPGGKVVVTPSPPVAADLSIDGRPSGQLPPFVRTLSAGKHRLEVRAEGYRPFATSIEVSAGGKPLEVAAELQAEGPMHVEGVVLTRPVSSHEQEK